jgi:hypothetical protein
MTAWTAEPLPAETVAVVRAQLPTLVDGIIDQVRSGNHVYGEVLSAPEGMALRLGIEQAIRAFLEAVERGERPAADTDELWRQLGEAEYQSGRSLDDLRMAFRLGIRAAWRGAADVAARAGISAPVVIAMAEAIFVYGDDLAADVVEGYLRMQSDRAGERERRRRRLAAALLDPGAHDPRVLAHAAELAGWPLPRRLAVVALTGDEPAAAARRLDLDVLAGADGEGAWLIVPDPDGPGRAGAMARALSDIPAAIGPTVGPAQAPWSLRLGRLTLSLLGRGALAGPATPPRAEDHLTELIVLDDLELAEALVHRSLAGLEGLPGGERDRLAQTLDAWLGHQRHTPAIAAELHVHPQTVRYRMARLRELLGDALDSPAGRFELALALRIRAALA